MKFAPDCSFCDKKLDILNNHRHIGNMSDTPRTDAEYAKTLNSDYEYVGAEDEAWEWARKLERELAGIDWEGLREIVKGMRAK